MVFAYQPEQDGVLTLGDQEFFLWILVLPSSSWLTVGPVTLSMSRMKVVRTDPLWVTRMSLSLGHWSPHHSTTSSLMPVMCLNYDTRLQPMSEVRAMQLITSVVPVSGKILLSLSSVRTPSLSTLPKYSRSLSRSTLVSPSR